MGSFIPPTSAQGLTNLEGLRQVVCIVPGVALVVLPWSRRFEQPPILLCIPKSAPSMSTPAVVMATGTATKHAPTTSRHSLAHTNTRSHKITYVTRTHARPTEIRHDVRHRRETPRYGMAAWHGTRHTAQTQTQLYGHGHGHGHGHTDLEHGAQTRDFACARHTRHARSFTLGKSITAR
jgi:hypothetical protein